MEKDKIKLTTFIIPSIGRNTLTRTLESIRCQTLQDYEILVIFDNVSNISLFNLEGCKVFNTQKKLGVEDILKEHNSGGEVRNFGLNLCNTKYISFVDDDDIICKTYCEQLAAQDNIMFVSRMFYTDKNLPKGVSLIIPDASNELRYGNIGINISVKREFLIDRSIKFVNSPKEDWDFVSKILKYNPTIKVSNEVLYLAGI